MILPPEAIPPRIAAVLWSVVRGAGSYRDIQEDCSLASPSHAKHWADQARQMELIRAEPLKCNTIRPAVEVVAISPRQTTPAVKPVRHTKVRLQCECGETFESIKLLTEHTLREHGRGPHDSERVPLKGPS